MHGGRRRPCQGRQQTWACAVEATPALAGAVAHCCYDGIVTQHAQGGLLGDNGRGASPVAQSAPGLLQSAGHAETAAHGS